MVADTIEADPETWSDPILGCVPVSIPPNAHSPRLRSQSRESYVSAILGPNTWGGAIELSIFAANAKTEICSIDVQSGRVDWFGQGKGYDTRVILIYSGIRASPSPSPPSRSPNSSQITTPSLSPGPTPPLPRRSPRSRSNSIRPSSPPRPPTRCSPQLFRWLPSSERRIPTQTQPRSRAFPLTGEKRADGLLVAD